MLTINPIKTNNPSFQSLKSVSTSDFLKYPTEGRLNSIKEFYNSQEIKNFCDKYDVYAEFGRDYYDYAKGCYDKLMLFVTNFVDRHGRSVRIDLDSYDKERSLIHTIRELKPGDLERMLQKQRN